MPSEDVLEEGLFLGVAGEWYLKPRVSVRGQFGGAWHDVFAGGLDGKVRTMQFTGNVVYNWERGKWHPYAGGGLGLYRFRFGDENETAPADTKFGVNLGGGIEYFFTRSDTLLGDITIHLVPGHADSNVWGYQARYWTISGGYKKYF